MSLDYFVILFLDDVTPNKKLSHKQVQRVKKRMEKLAQKKEKLKLAQKKKQQQLNIQQMRELKNATPGMYWNHVCIASVDNFICDHKKNVGKNA